MSIFAASHRFEFARQPFVTPMDVELMLRRYGIPINGRDMGELWKHGDGGKGDKVNRNDYGWFTLSVPEARAVWVEYLLCKWGYPPNQQLLNPKHYNIADPSHMPPEWGVPAEVKTFTDWVLKIMCAVTGGASWDLRPQVKRSARKVTKLGKTYR
ncbi:hypothetical protein BH10CHL1_BH10CHL1_01590 [soil metagenome]